MTAYYNEIDPRAEDSPQGPNFLVDGRRRYGPGLPDARRL